MVCRFRFAPSGFEPSHLANKQTFLQGQALLTAKSSNVNSGCGQNCCSELMCQAGAMNLGFILYALRPNADINVDGSNIRYVSVFDYFNFILFLYVCLHLFFGQAC